MTTQSPIVKSIKWGCIEIDGYTELRDAKLYPGGARSWDWNETGTHHIPGIQPADVHELITNGSEIIILTRGMHLMLHTCPETLELLDKLNIQTIAEETQRAVAIYNEFVVDGQRVGGLFHSTC